MSIAADRIYVIRACKLKNLDLIKPSKGAEGILAYAQNVSNPLHVGACVVCAGNWTDARTQINNYFKVD